MTDLHNSLMEISKQYTIFVKDQVLTEEQLNSVSAYMDDQNRLNRTVLTGVGIVGGLHVTEASGKLVLSKGLGITSDGDLLINYQNQEYDRFKDYPVSAPEYEPFKSGSERIPLFQFITQGETDPDSKNLTELDTDLSNLVFILLAETYIEDKDICTGTNCDNGSRTYTSHTRLLATMAEFADTLMKTFEPETLSPDKLERLYMPAITIEPSINTQAEWFTEIRNACKSGFNQLSQEMKSFRTLTQSNLSEHINPASISGWATKLSQIDRRARNETSRLQYYYEFLDDLCEAWNVLLDCLSDVTPGYLNPPRKGSKHLLLGQLSASDLRTGFYPAYSNTDDGLSAVIFQINKITALITQFRWAGISSLKITPSSHSIPSVPGYYQPAIFDHWQYEASQQGRNRYLLGYHADKNNPKGNADKPLLRRLNKYEFFRIEGVIGKSFQAIESSIKNLIRKHHLPFSVIGVLVEGSYLKVIKPIFRPAPGLKNLSYLLKKDLSYQLQDVSKFSRQFKDKVIEHAKVEEIREGDIADLETLVSSRDTEIKRATDSAISLLKKATMTSAEQKIFKSNISTAIKTAGMFKNDVSKVSSTHYPTYFDQLIVNRTPAWVDWIDLIDKEEEKKQTEKHLLPNFVNAHPGLELMSGVPRGGTFVMLYNSDGTVIGSGMLSHYIEPKTEVTVRPELPEQEPPFLGIPIPGIKVIPSLDFSLDKKFTDYDKRVSLKINQEIQLQQPAYTNVLKDSLGIVRELYTTNVKTSDIKVDETVNVRDTKVEAALENLAEIEKEISVFDKRILTTRDLSLKQQLIREKAQAQEKMADSILELASHLTETESTDSGSTQEKAINEIVLKSEALAGNQTAINRVTSEVDLMKNTEVGKTLNSRLVMRFNEL